MYKLFIQRKVGKRTSDEKILAQVDQLIERGLGGARGKTWECTEKKRIPPVQRGKGWVFTYELVFQKTSGPRGGEAEYRQWEDIKAMIVQSGLATRYTITNSPWLVTDPQNNATNATNPATGRAIRMVNTDDAKPTPPPENLADIVAEASEAIATRLLGGVREVGSNYDTVSAWKDLKVPPEFLGPDSDRALGEHPAWKDLYDLGPQLRVLFNNINRAAETDGDSRNHGVLFGHSGCGKTTTLLSLEKMFGPGAVLRLDATSTTRAGLEKMFFNDLKEVPPLVFMEEAEKADPEALKIWLGALDDRGEIRKVNFRVNQLRSLKVLFICTVNNKGLFDRMMGSDGSTGGALSSRCVSQIYFPRPSDDTLKQILKKEIDQHGGSLDWIAPALGLAKELGVSDPRVVRHYLAGGDRLLDGSYQRDWKAINQAAKDFQRNG